MYTHFATIRSRRSGIHKVQLLRADVVPLLTLAFLLLFFFVYERTNGPLRQLELWMPPKPGYRGCGGFYSIDENKIYTIILDKDKIYTYGFYPDLKADTVAYENLPAVVAGHLNRHPNRCAKGAKLEEIKATRCWDPIFIIKPRNTCTYGQFISAMSEMERYQVAKYAIADYTANDEELLQYAHSQAISQP